MPRDLPGSAIVRCDVPSPQADIHRTVAGRFPAHRHVQLQGLAWNRYLEFLALRRQGELLESITNDGPREALRINNVEVTGRRYGSDRYSFGNSARHRSPSAWKIRRNLIVIRSLQKDLRNMEWQQVARIAGPIAIGKILWSPAHESKHLLLVVREGEVSGEVDGEAKINGSSKRERTRKRYLWSGLVDFAARVNMVPSGDPKSEMAARGVPGGKDSCQVDRVLLCKRRNKVKAGCRILKRGRPTTSRKSDSPVLNRPAGDTLRFQRCTQVPGIAQIICRLPPTTVIKHHQRKPNTMRMLWQPQITELARAGSIGNAVIW